MEHFTQNLCVEFRQNLLDYISRMNLAVNRKLPSEEQLSKKFNVSRATVRTALAMLEQEGKLFRKQGRGTYINPLAFESTATLYPFLRYHDIIRSKGYTPSSKKVSTRIEPADHNVAKFLCLPEGHPVIRHDLLICGDDQPFVYIIDYFDTNQFDEAKLADSVFNFEFLKDYGTEIAWSRATLFAAVSTQIPDVNRLFRLAPDTVKPLLGMNREYFSQEDEILLYAKCYVDTDMIQFNFFQMCEP